MNRKVDTMDWDKVFLIFVDKLLIGLVLLGVAYWTKRVLQKSKMTFGFSLKFSEEKIRRIGEIWMNIDECEALLRKFQRTSERTENNSDPTKKSELRSQLRSVGDEVIAKFDTSRLQIDRNRFWLGDDAVYRSLVSHIDLLGKHMNAFNKLKEEGRTPMKRVDEEIEESRKTVVDYMKLPRK